MPGPGTGTDQSHSNHGWNLVGAVVQEAGEPFLSKTSSNGVPALKDPTLTIAVGMCGLLGFNAGKATLVRILWRQC
jgi:ABC-type polysaccharide/polyol phosphate transport system ATPase subunit